MKETFLLLPSDVENKLENFENECNSTQGDFGQNCTFSCLLPTSLLQHSMKLTWIEHLMKKHVIT